MSQTYEQFVLPVYPFIITYEDWYLFTPHVVDALTDCVKHRLEADSLPITLTETMPFFITSISEFESAGQAMAQIGIERFCGAGAAIELRHFQLSGLAQKDFPSEKIVYRRLLDDSWEKIFPEMQNWERMAVARNAT